jgi:hypothetical protein
MRGFALAIVIGLALGGCTHTPEQDARSVCTAFCQCFDTPLPGPQQQCVDDCAPRIQTVSDACLQCTFENEQACSMLLDQCFNLCLNGPMP